MTAATELIPWTRMTVAEAAAILGAEVAGDAASRPFGPVSTDTRSIGPGEFFLALTGENFDGHDFCGKAIERGAAGAIVRRDFKFQISERPSPVILRVADPLRSYGELGAWRRRQWGGALAAISGSVGKTTTRRLVARAMRDRLRALEPIRNFNNLIGLPHTLLRLEDGHEAAVVELGMNQPGELSRLAEIARPDVAALTRIGRAHIGLFGSIGGLIEAKLSLFEATAPGRPLVLNAACPHSVSAIPRFSGEHPIVTFRADGSERADVAAMNVAPIAPVGYRFDLKIPGGRIEGMELRHFGRHMVENVAAAAAILHASGRDPRWIADAVADFATEPDRGQVERVGDWTFILDCYNAAPESMVGALESLAESPHAGRTALVLADMLELGDRSRAIHDDLLAPLRRLRADAAFVLGEQMARLARTLRGEGIEARSFDDAEALREALRAWLRPGDRILFKGAHGFALERVARALARREG
jgi:UDP-N-acetylmuramoyl-tripeptide--D-alanyl-D-alanine ligase